MAAVNRKQPLRWRKAPRETGLARVCTGPRGAELRIGDDVLARVYYDRGSAAWTWVATSEKYGVPYKNTYLDPTSFIAAKENAMAYVIAHLQR